MGQLVKLLIVHVHLDKCLLGFVFLLFLWCLGGWWKPFFECRVKLFFAFPHAGLDGGFDQCRSDLIIEFAAGGFAHERGASRSA